MSDAYSNIRARLSGVQDKGDDSCEARCPAHEDNRQSLSLSRGDDGRALLCCHVGCTAQEIVSAVGLTMKDLFPPSENGYVRNGQSNGHAGNSKRRGKSKSSKPLGKIVATYDYRDESGTLLFQKVRDEDKEFRQRAPKPGGGWNWSIKGVRKILYNLDKLAADRESVVWFFEGEKDCDNATKRGLLATTNPVGASKGDKPKFDKKLAEQLRGRDVRLCGDNDEPGRNHVQHVAKLLHGVAKSVRIVELAGLPEKGDVSDWFDAGGTAEQLQALGEDAEEFSPKPNDGRAEIVVSTDEESMADEAIAALARLPRDENGVYQRGGILARIVKSAPKGKGIKRPDGAPTITPLPTPSLREKIATAAQFFKLDGEGNLNKCGVPENVVKAVDARGYWPGIASIEAVVEVPILRADGSVLESPGFDEATGIYFYRGGGVFPSVPEQPTRDDALAALAKLLDILADFPFVSEAHRAAAVAVILTPFGRFAYDGCTPFALYEANTPGAGKGLLSEVSATIWSKTGIPRMALPTRDEEFAKKITSLLIAGDLLINWDNIRGGLGGPALEAVLTSRVWKDRILGASKMTANMPVNLIHTGTGNNCTLIGDMPRRVLNIRLEVEQENAEERTGFRHPDLLGFVREHRGELAVAAVTILAAYHVVGKPSQKLPAWGTFDEWSNLIRSAVVWVGMDDPAKTRIELRDRADTEAAALRQLLAGWEELDPDNKGLSVVEAIALLDGYPDRYVAAREAMAELFNHTKAKPASTKAIGKRLSGFRRRVANGRRFDFREDRNGTKHWFVDVAAGYAGFAGCSYNPPRAHARTRTHAHTEGCVEQPANPANPATPDSPGPCSHEPHERLTHDKYIRTECRRCGEVLKPDRKAEAVGA